MFRSNLNQKIDTLLRQVPAQRQLLVAQASHVYASFRHDLTSPQTLTTVALVGVVIGMQSQWLNGVATRLMIYRIKRSISALATE